MNIKGIKMPPRKYKSHDARNVAIFPDNAVLLDLKRCADLSSVSLSKPHPLLPKTFVIVCSWS